MMELDEAIKHCEVVIEKKNEELALYHSYKLYEYIPACHKCAQEHEQLAEWLKELKEHREVDRWISVSERLPKEDTDILLYTEDFGFVVGRYSKTKDYEGKYEMAFIIHYSIASADWATVYPIAWLPIQVYDKENNK